MSEARKEYTIPTFPHLKKFMLKTEPHKGSVILVDEYSVLGKVITLALLDRRAWKEVSAFNTSERSAKLTESIKLILTKEQSEMAVRQSKLLRINIDMDRVFKSHLLTFIEAKKQDGTPVRIACKNFLQYLDLDDSDYSLDSAYKHYQRDVLKKTTNTVLS
jgi:hypothetical protein